MKMIKLIIDKKSNVEGTGTGSEDDDDGKGKKKKKKKSGTTTDSDSDLMGRKKKRKGEKDRDGRKGKNMSGKRGRSREDWRGRGKDGRGRGRDGRGGGKDGRDSGKRGRGRGRDGRVGGKDGRESGKSGRGRGRDYGGRGLDKDGREKGKYGGGGGREGTRDSLKSDRDKEEDLKGDEKLLEDEMKLQCICRRRGIVCPGIGPCGGTRNAILERRKKGILKGMEVTNADSCLNLLPLNRTPFKTWKKFQMYYFQNGQLYYKSKQNEIREKKRKFIENYSLI